MLAFGFNLGAPTSGGESDSAMLYMQKTADGEKLDPDSWESLLPEGLHASGSESLEMRNLAMNAYATRIAVGGNRKEVVIYEMNLAVMNTELQSHMISPVLKIRAGGKVASMALSKPGHTLAVVTEVPDVSIYCTYTGAQLFTQTCKERLRCAALKALGVAESIEACV